MDHTRSGPVANECVENSNLHGFDDKVGTSLKSAIFKKCYSKVTTKNIY